VLDGDELQPTSGGGTSGGTTSAPEIDPTGAMSGITLLLGESPGRAG
jgi:hypothetical protein